jgi:HEAT repeat protein
VLLFAGVGLTDVILERVYIQRLEATDLSVRVAAAEGLGNLGSRFAVPPLMAFVKDPSEEKELRVVSALALVKVGEEVIPRLLDVLRKVGPLRRDIEIAMAGVADESDAALLVMLAVPFWNPGKLSGKSSDWGPTGPGTVTLTTSFSPGSIFTRSSPTGPSGSVVSRLSFSPALKLPGQEAAVRTASRLKELRPDPVTALINAFQCPYPAVLHGAAWVLTALDADTGAAVPTVLDALKDPCFRKFPRSSANIGPTMVVGCDGRLPLVAVLRQNTGVYPHKIQTALLELLQDSEWCIAQAATEALGEMGAAAAAAVPAILQKFHEGEGTPTGVEVEALGKIRSGTIEAMPVLALALNSTDTTLRRRACGALRDDKASAQALISEFMEAFASEGVELRPRKAERCIRSLGVPFVRPFIGALSDERPRVRQGARRALRRMAAESWAAIPDLIEALSDKEAGVREGVALALGQATSGVPEVTLALETLLEGDNERVRKAAAASLARVKNRYR